VIQASAAMIAAQIGSSARYGERLIFRQRAAKGWMANQKSGMLLYTIPASQGMSSSLASMEVIVTVQRHQGTFPRWCEPGQYSPIT
jgi:hypothetical protein